jgi:hypothetical protein
MAAIATASPVMSRADAVKEVVKPAGFAAESMRYS